MRKGRDSYTAGRDGVRGTGLEVASADPLPSLSHTVPWGCRGGPFLLPQHPTPFPGCRLCCLLTLSALFHATPRAQAGPAVPLRDGGWASRPTNNPTSRREKYNIIDFFLFPCPAQNPSGSCWSKACPLPWEATPGPPAVGVVEGPFSDCTWLLRD